MSARGQSINSVIDSLMTSRKDIYSNHVIAFVVVVTYSTITV